MTHQYARAEQLLIRAFPLPVTSHDVTKFPLTNGHAYPLVQFSTVHPNIAALAGKGKGKQVDSPTSPQRPVRVPVGPSSMINAAVEYPNGASRLVDMSVACRYLAALCQVRYQAISWIDSPSAAFSKVRQGKWHSATEMLGESNPFRDSGMNFSPHHDLSLIPAICRQEWTCRSQRGRGYKSTPLRIEVLSYYLTPEL
jgi:anaphase-promoting complex subunit 6